jgi:hypothetical protein
MIEIIVLIVVVLALGSVIWLLAVNAGQKRKTDKTDNEDER